VIVLEPPGSSQVLVLGLVRGLVGEGPKAVARAEAFRPDAIALGLTPEETTSLREHFVGARTEPLVPLAPTELHEARSLVRYGEVAVPNPGFLALLDWATARNLPAEGVDADEDVQAELFVANIGFVELVRRTLGERRVGRKPPDVMDADAFALAWDRTAHPGRGSRRYARATGRALVSQLDVMRKEHPRVLLAVDRERAERLLPLLSDSTPA
jgi:hypothetical protein